MRKYSILMALLLFPLCGMRAQRILTLEECRQLALEHNKSLSQKRIAQRQADETHKAARTNYLPKLDLTAGFVRSGRETHLLSDEQRKAVSNLGTSSVNEIHQSMQQAMAQNPKLAQTVGALLKKNPELQLLLNSVDQGLQSMGNAIDHLGDGVIDAIRTDTRNVGGGAILLMQPLYMGGKIKAYDRITNQQRGIAEQQYRQEEQSTLLETERAYWQTVSLVYKLRLAKSYLATLQHLDEDVNKMIKEGVATQADGLQIGVKVGEAEMMVTKVEDGLTLSRMLLSQICGLPLNESFQTQDECQSEIKTSQDVAQVDTLMAFNSRPELMQLKSATDIYQQKVAITRSDFLPHLALLGSYAVSYPNVYNGFERRFRGDWHVGVTLKVPVWNWFEGKHKVRAAKAEAEMARLKESDIRDKIALEVTQQTFRVNESNKRIAIAERNIAKAAENLRVATLGYKEGVTPMSDVLAAETSKLQADSEKIDAQIESKLSRAAWRKAVGQEP